MSPTLCVIIPTTMRKGSTLLGISWDYFYGILYKLASNRLLPMMKRRPRSSKGI